MVEVPGSLLWPGTGERADRVARCCLPRGQRDWLSQQSPKGPADLDLDPVLVPPPHPTGLSLGWLVAGRWEANPSQDHVAGLCVHRLCLRHRPAQWEEAIPSLLTR